MSVVPNPSFVAGTVRGPQEAEGRIEWRQGDALALDLPDRGFDLVICQQGLQFFPDRAAGLREMRRVLVDGGRVLLAVWRGPEHHPLYEGMAAAEAPHLAELGVPMTYEDLTKPFSLGDPDELVGLLTDAAFDAYLASISAATEELVDRYRDGDHIAVPMDTHLVVASS